MRGVTARRATDDHPSHGQIEVEHAAAHGPLSALVPGREPWRESRPSFRSTIPLALVGLALLGSVAIPARQTWRITQLLRESTQVLAPARLLVEKLQAGLAREFVAVQGYALSGDVAQLARYRASADEDERWLAEIERLAARFDSTAAARARSLRTRIGGWRRFNDSLVAQGASPVRVVAALREEQSRYDASLGAISSLSSDLVDDAAARDDQVRTLEHLSIASNAVLVLAALVAMSGVAALTIQERKLTAALRRRVDEEAALREAAESLGSAYTVDEVTQRAGAAGSQHDSTASRAWDSRATRERAGHS
mgnify:CR=1 FL=1